MCTKTKVWLCSGCLLGPKVHLVWCGGARLQSVGRAASDRRHALLMQADQPSFPTKKGNWRTYSEV